MSRQTPRQQAPRLRELADRLRDSGKATDGALRALRALAQQQDGMAEWDEDYVVLAQALDAVLDEAMDAFQGGETDQGVALAVAASVTSDALLVAMGLPDPDESEPVTPATLPVVMASAGPRELDVVRGLAPQSVELRAAAAGTDTLGTLSGHFSAFDVWYEVDSLWEGKFLERVAPGSFAQTIAEDRADMRILYDHGFDPQIGNKVLAPVDDVREDKIGPYYEGGLFDTSYNRDLLPGLRKGVYGASMRMRVLGESWDDEPGASAHNPKGVPERTITRAHVMEFGPVTFPANPAASAGVRSLTDRYYDQLKRRDSGAYAAAARAAGRAPYLTGRPAARSTGGGGSDDAQPGNGEASRVRAALRTLDVNPLMPKEHYRA
jgi:HK97 family phage prohead protease